MPFRRSIFAVLCLTGWLSAPAPVRAADGERMEYDITWVGVSVGAMTVQSATNEAGQKVRAVRIWNRPWIALVYPVDTTVECVIEQTPQGPRHVVTKKVAEKDFLQDDTMILLPDQGTVVWSNAVERTVRAAAVPKGSRDLVSFFFDLREVVAGSPLQAGGDYRLVMDGAIHDLEIKIGSPKVLRTPFGRREALPVEALSKSPTLFSRNRPKSVWVATSKPAVLFADVESRFGPVRATLVKWTQDGADVSFEPTPPSR